MSDQQDEQGHEAPHEASSADPAEASAPYDPASFQVPESPEQPPHDHDDAAKPAAAPAAPEMALYKEPGRAGGGPTVNLYDLDSYTFGVCEAQLPKDTSAALPRLERHRASYEREGMRRGVDGVLLAHQHGHPFVLLFQMGESVWRLPGGKVRPGEDDPDGLARKLAKLLGPPEHASRWEPGDLLAAWWRPNFDNYLYPYCPPHITRPKECRRMFIVPLPQRAAFAVPRNLKLLAIPLFDLYDNRQTYGIYISSIPQFLSRFTLCCL
eukprot:m51a1_g11080 hypothetical protein (267) ;mRNA; f:574734-575612